MRSSLRVSRRARRQIAEAANWYDQQRDGLGDRFDAEVTRCLRLLSVGPLLYQVVFHSTRRLLLPGFSYAILYRHDAVGIVVLAVVHTSRDPGQWRVREQVAGYSLVA